MKLINFSLVFLIILCVNCIGKRITQNTNSTVIESEINSSTLINNVSPLPSPSASNPLNKNNKPKCQLQELTKNRTKNNLTSLTSLSSNIGTVTGTGNNSTSSNISIRNNSIMTDDLLNIIADQTENIKNEICSSCLEINSALDTLIEEIKIIKLQIRRLDPKQSDLLGSCNKKNTTNTNNTNTNANPTNSTPNNSITTSIPISGKPLSLSPLPSPPAPPSLTKRELFSIISNCVNNLNLIKADLFKLNEVLSTLQKANCINFTENSKKYSLVVDSTNKLLEIIQNVLRNLNINLNIVVLN
jgi:hypothetical protein